MKRSITWFGVTLGAAALFALGTGCTRESRPAQPPTQGATSPTFESNVPPAGAESGAMGQQGAMGGQQGTAGEQPGQQGQQGTAGYGQQGAQQGAPPGTMGSALQGQGGQPGGEGAQAPAGTAPPQAAGPSEREMCSTLASTAKLHVEDVQNGVAIVATPKAGNSMTALRDDTQRIERSIHQRAGEQGAAGETCGLFSLARLPSVTTSLSEGANAVRIVMTTSNPTEVKDLRRVARDQVNTLIKSAPGGQQPRGGQHQRGAQPR